MRAAHDAFIAGHGNTALSVAIGIAWAKKLKGEPGHVVAIIGDGAFTGGMVYEGMNNIGKLDNFLVILNDNKMSISHNVGALAGYLGHLRTTNGYFTAKENVSSFLNGCACHRSAHQKRSSEQQKSDPPGHVPFHDVRGYGFSLFWTHRRPRRAGTGAHFPDRLCSARADAAPCRDEERQGLCAC